LYLAELVDAYARVRIVDHQGTEVGRVPLPGRGALSELPSRVHTLGPRAHPDEYLFCFSTLTESWGCYRHRPGDAHVETLREPQVRLDAAVEDLSATSADGTRVPYHVVRRPDVSDAAPQPTLIWAYGGFNTALVPEFPGMMAAFVESGGVFVHAHLRGGAEYGYEWWQGGRGDRKQNCYADLFAVAEDLIARERTTTDLLAVTGESNGGLMTGVAITQRPDLWRAAVPRVARLDLVGSCREPYGWSSVFPELGDPSDPDGVARLAAISPYHLVEDGTAYPAVFIDTGATDPRCSPRNGRKFAARLQEANASEHPIFLRVWDNVGHGAATTKEREIEQNTAWLAFVMDQLGMSAAGGAGE
jgi:prolyl oligopeptidase